MECIKVQNQPISDLAKQYDVNRTYIFKMKQRGYSDEQIIKKIQEMNSTSYKLNKLFLKYVSVHLTKILLVFENPDMRKQIKHEFFNHWSELGLPITQTKLEYGWQKIVKGAYYDAN